MPFRSPKNQRKYVRYAKTLGVDECQFCAVDASFSHFLHETKSFKVIENLFPYSDWDSIETKDHLLIVPKKHVTRFGEMSKSEYVELMDLISSYELKGYSIWARTPTAKTRSVIHQHTHLIKPGVRSHRFMFYIRRPYIRVLRSS